MCDEKFTSHLIRGHPKTTHTGRGTGGGVMAKPYGCVLGVGWFKLGEYVRILTAYFPFLKIFSIKEKNEND